MSRKVYFPSSLFSSHNIFSRKERFRQSQSEPHPHIGRGANITQELDNTPAIAPPTDWQCAVRLNTEEDKGGFLGDDAILPMWKYKHKVALQQPGTKKDNPNLHFQSTET